MASAVMLRVEGLVALTTRDMLESESKCSGQHMDLLCTVCPKVPWKSNVPLFSAICGQILKPFGLLIATKVRFVMVYDKA